MSETKKTTVAPKASGTVVDSEKETLAAQLKASQDMNTKMMQMLQEMQAQLLKVQTSSATQPSYSATSTDVTLVYASTSPGYLFVEGSGLSLHCTKYGETFSLSRSQLDALVGKYRSWFDQGILALADKDAKVAGEKGVYTFGQLKLGVDTLNKLGRMTAAEVESLWDSLTMDSQKESLVLFYKQKFIEGAAGYNDRSKIDMLNRLTNNGFSRESIEASGMDLKLRPIDLA